MNQTLCQNQHTIAMKHFYHFKPFFWSHITSFIAFGSIHALDSLRVCSALSLPFHLSVLKRALVFWSQAAWVRLSLCTAFEKILILHEKEIPKATSVTWHDMLAKFRARANETDVGRTSIRF